MSRWPSLRRSLLVVAVTLIGGSGLHAQAAQPMKASTFSKPGIRLSNGRATPIRVEIRAGIDRDCSKAPVLRTITVEAGKSWDLRSTQPICIRQEDVAPDGKRQWRAWVRKDAVAGRVEEVTL